MYLHIKRTCSEQFHGVSERRVQAVLLRQQLRQVFTLALHHVGIVIAVVVVRFLSFDAVVTVRIH